MYALFCLSESLLLDIELRLPKVGPAVARIVADKSVALFVLPCRVEDGRILFVDAR